MPLAYTTEELITEVRNRSMTPDADSPGTRDADLLLYLNSEMMNELIPRVSKLHEEFWVVTELITLSVNDPDSTFVEIPDRAVGTSLRDLFIVDGGDRAFIPQINREDLAAYQIVRGEGTDIRGFFIEGNRIRIFPGVAASGNQLEVSYQFRPSQLVLAASYTTITAVDTALKQITVAATAPINFSVDQLIDIHGPNSGAEIRVWDNKITAISSQTVTLTDPIDGNDTREGRKIVKVGDYLVPREESAIPMLPRETHTILAQAAVCRVIESLDDQEKLAMHTKTLDRWLNGMNYNIAKRVRGRPRVIVNRKAPLWRQGNIQRRSL